MKISRTQIAAVVSVFAGLMLVIFGIDIDAETQTSLIDNINNIIGLVMVVYGVLIGILRKITSSPLSGWFTK